MKKNEALWKRIGNLVWGRVYMGLCIHIYIYAYMSIYLYIYTLMCMYIYICILRPPRKGKPHPTAASRGEKLFVAWGDEELSSPQISLGLAY